MIEAKNITKSFANQEVLKDVSVCFEKGKTNLVIGQSGSGKTVLIKCMVGLHEVDSGKIEYDGRVFSDMKTRKRGPNTGSRKNPAIKHNFTAINFMKTHHTFNKYGFS
jgi:phospholipid/cholesterol/gamma-HCH transport system ATP-binding protein